MSIAFVPDDCNAALKFVIFVPFQRSYMIYYYRFTVYSMVLFIKKTTKSSVNFYCDPNG